MQEILIILGIALVIFGPRRLPEMGKTLGKALGEFRRATTDLKRSVKFEIDAEEDRQREDTEAKERAARQKAQLNESTEAEDREAKVLPDATIAASALASQEPAAEKAGGDDAEPAMLELPDSAPKTADANAE